MTSSGASHLRIVLLGPPASGKGTQGRRLAESLQLGYLSTGALLREQVGNHTDLGLLAEPILARGEYLPDDLMCRIIAAWLEKQSGGWVLDGFPRSLPQAAFLDQWLDDRKLAVDRAISLEVPFEELLSRIQGRLECPECRWSGQSSQAVDGQTCPACGAMLVSRSDDTEENFTSRHQEFVRLTLPVVNHYGRLGRLVSINATAPKNEVTATLLAHFSSNEKDA